MERRSFVRTGLLAGVWGLGGSAVAPDLLTAIAPSRAKGPIKLSSNENPLGISPSAREAVIEGLVDANRYPGATRRKLVAALAKKHSVGEESIATGAGSTEILRMAVSALVPPGGRLVVADPTYEDLPWYAGPPGVEVIKVPLKSDFSHDIDRMDQAAHGTSEPVLMYVCNPNNPTGTLTACREVDAWIASAPERVNFLVDEAYFEYCRDSRYWSALSWIPDRPNVVVARTFSKIFGMAGMRLGYAIAHPDTAARLRRLATRNNVNHLAGVAGLASLDDTGFAKKSLEINDRGSAVLYECLNELGIEYLQTNTNFVMHRITGDLEAYIERMREHEIRVGRPFPPMLSYNRLSIGLPEEMERFAETLRSFRNKGWI